jgi:hypothetical protein
MEYVMTRKDELVAEYWDFYKEVYNVRPRWVDFASCTEEDLVEMLTRLGEQAKVVWEQRELDQVAAIEKLELLVRATIATGAGSREDALRWLMEASGCNGDWDYFCWEQGIPYGYFKSIA